MMSSRFRSGVICGIRNRGTKPIRAAAAQVNANCATPVIGTDGTVYAASDDNKVYALNPDGTLKWSFLTTFDIYSPLALGADGSIYAITAVNRLYALKPDGTLKWSYNIGGQSLSGRGGGLSVVLSVTIR